MVTTKNPTYAEIGRKIRAIEQEKPDSSYEWEELVQKLCASDDAGLQDIGKREHDALRQKRTKCSEKKK